MVFNNDISFQFFSKLSIPRLFIILFNASILSSFLSAIKPHASRCLQLFTCVAVFSVSGLIRTHTSISGGPICRSPASCV